MFRRSAFLKKNNFVLAVLGLHCCLGYSLAVVSGLLTVVVPLVMEHGLQGAGSSVDPVCGFSSCPRFTGSRAQP